MKRLVTAGIVAMLVVGLGGLAVLARGGGAAAAAGQYKKPALKLVVHENSFGGDYDIIVVGSGYTDTQPGGDLVLTCTKGSTCAHDPFPTPGPWPEGPVDPPDGSFSFDYHFSCPSEVKSAQAVDANGVKSSPAKGAC